MKKSENDYWILHTLISMVIKFQPKLTILTFWTKYAKKGYFQFKIEKVNTTIDFSIFELD